MSVEQARSSHAPGPSVRSATSPPPKVGGTGNGGLFWWSIGLIILTGIAIFSWVFCLYVFSYPDKAFNYDLLTRLNKLEPPKDFKIMEVPSGPQLTAREVYREYYQMEADLQRVKNEDLLRAYLWNYNEDDAPIYITGKFEALESRKLTEEDLFTTGIIVRAKSVDYPNVFLDFVFPMSPEDIEDEHFKPGDTLILEKKRLYASVINLAQPTEDNLLITAVSLIYGRYRIDDRRFVDQTPPTTLNVESQLPAAGMAVPGA